MSKIEKVISTIGVWAVIPVLCSFEHIMLDMVIVVALMMMFATMFIWEGGK